MNKFIILVVIFVTIEVTIISCVPVEGIDEEKSDTDDDLKPAEAIHTSLYGYNSDRYPNYPRVFSSYPFDYSE